VPGKALGFVESGLALKVSDLAVLSVFAAVGGPVEIPLPWEAVHEPLARLSRFYELLESAAGYQQI